MKKFIIAAVVIAIAVVAVNKADAALHERNIRAVERSIAVDRLANGQAPMQVECERAGEMVFRVDPDTGVTRCSGAAGNFADGKMLQDEISAMAEMDAACARDNGVLIVEKTINSDSTTVLACNGSKFQSYWTGK